MKDESCVVFLVNHAITDGVGFMLMLAGIQDTFNSKQAPFFRVLTSYDKLVEYFKVIFLMPFILLLEITGGKNNVNFKQL